MSKRKKQAPNDLSSDIVEHEEYGVVADEESNARSNASGETQYLSVEVYKETHGESHLDVLDFCRLHQDSQRKLIFALDSLTPIPLLGQHKQLSSAKKDDLKAKIASGELRRTVYTQIIEGATIIKGQSDLPSLDEKPVSKPTQSMASENRKVHWSEWVNAPINYGLAYSPLLHGKHDFTWSIDIDATVFHTDTLYIMQQSFELFLGPNYHLSVPKINHRYQNVALHNVVNLQIGTFAGKWNIIACFPGYSKNFAKRGQLIKAFYIEVLLKGLRSSLQAGRAGIYTDLEAFVKNEQSKHLRSVVETGSFPEIEALLKTFTFENKNVAVCFTFQYYGEKEILEDDDKMKQYISYMESIFDIVGIVDPENKRFSNTLFIQDVAIAISPNHDRRNMMTCFWNPNWVQNLGQRKVSGLRELLILNQRYSKPNASNDIPKDSKAVMYPNLGVGNLQSAMISWTSLQNAVIEIKAYYSASAVWRNNAPYSGTCYSVAALPFRTLFSGSSLGQNEQNTIANKVNAIATNFSEKCPEDKKIRHILETMRASSYGARLEVSFQNVGKRKLLAAFDYLSLLAESIIGTHVTLSSLYQDKEIPIETLRFSPIQVVKGESLMALVEFQTKLCNKMFKSIYLPLIKDQITSIRTNAVNTLAILEDVQQLLWSGSIPTLHNPRLFAQLDIIKLLERYNRIFLPAEVFKFNCLEPIKSSCTITRYHKKPEEANFEPEEDENDAAPLAEELVLTGRFFYQAFGKLSNEAMEVCQNLSSAVKLQMISPNSLLEPMYESRSMVIAANLLNEVFQTIFSVIGLDKKNYQMLFALLCQEKKFKGGCVVVEEQEHPKQLGELVRQWFPMSEENAAQGVINQPFYKLWQFVCSNIDSMNREAHFSNYNETRMKNGFTYTMRDVITKLDIIQQMVILLSQKVSWVPVFDHTNLVAKDGDGKGKFTLLETNYSSPVFLRNIGMSGIPLPHPVDGSFVFMVLKIVASKMAAASKERYTAWLSKKKNNNQLNLFAYQNSGSGRKRKRDQIDQEEKVVRFTENELLGHLLYHYFIEQEQYGEKPALPHYHNVTKLDLLKSKLLVEGRDYRTLDTVSPLQIYNTYIEHRNQTQ